LEGWRKKQNHDFWWWSQWCFIRCWSPLLLTWPGWPWHCRGRWQNVGSPGQRDPINVTPCWWPIYVLHILSISLSCWCIMG
jgi:hypothetical protein